jgi:hypothetical protein
MIKKFESFDTQWIEIMQTFDVYQLYELLVFKYGEIFTETKRLIDEYEEDLRKIKNISDKETVDSLHLTSSTALSDFLKNENESIF